jgi:acyl dehydratase
MASRTVIARNWATSSENKIHDDSVARRFGFRGGLVPGVTLFAYLVGPMLDDVGDRWLAGGFCDVRFTAPVYEGEEVTGSCVDGVLSLTAGSDESRVVGRAWWALPGELDRRPRAGDLPADRPPVSDSVLAPGSVLGAVRHLADGDAMQRYLTAVGLDAQEWTSGGVAHPGWLLLDANEILVRNVALGPWIHTGSVVRSLAATPLGSTLETRAEVLDRYERRGHRWVVLDVLTTADGQPVQRVRHTAIWRLREG